MVVILAIIQCPECHCNISDKATYCVHCGCPIGTDSSPIDEVDAIINDINSLLGSDASEKKCEQLYAIKFNGFITNNHYDNNRIKASSYVSRLLNRYRPEAEAVNCNEKRIIFDGLLESNAQKILKKLNNYGCLVIMIESDATEPSFTNKRIEKLQDQDSEIRCPRCNSSAISIGTRGYSIVWGFLGSNKTTNRCGRCGYSWSPK